MVKISILSWSVVIAVHQRLFSFLNRPPCCSNKGGQCLKCDFEPSFKERVNPRISEGIV
ncbi:MAG: hypothetical protein XD84_1308 [Desulfotomaculum sp. 46_80]|nr:MAG: hypothetical protein XD84_1308 [Desulfotomaculum sp. 46_80]